jgi:hypothetical protein
MTELCYTLVTDGTSDKALLPIIRWLLIKLGVKVAIQSQWADLGIVKNPPKKLHERIKVAIDIYPCDILFVHRDAEREHIERRVIEIRTAEKLLVAENTPPIVCVIPIRMIEAWILFDEMAIRKASGNPNGKEKLNLPKISKTEIIAEPKIMLEQIQDIARGLGKHRKKDKIPNIRIAEMIDDFEPLRNLSAFQELEKELKNTLENHFADLLNNG